MTVALSPLGLARARASEPALARAHYAAFLEQWAPADVAVPVVTAARTEAARLAATEPAGTGGTR
jgi:hypothetical protein